MSVWCAQARKLKKKKRIIHRYRRQSTCSPGVRCKESPEETPGGLGKGWRINWWESGCTAVGLHSLARPCITSWTSQTAAGTNVVICCVSNSYNRYWYVHMGYQVLFWHTLCNDYIKLINMFITSTFVVLTFKHLLSTLKWYMITN